MLRCLTLYNYGHNQTESFVKKTLWHKLNNNKKNGDNNKEIQTKWPQLMRNVNHIAKILIISSHNNNNNHNMAY